MKYTLRKGEEENINDAIIEKTGHTIEFTMHDIMANQKANDKARIELFAKSRNEKAKMENIEHFHPFVKDMSDEDLHTAWMYQESKGISSLCDAKIVEIDEETEKAKEEIEEIKKQLPELVEKVEEK